MASAQVARLQVFSSLSRSVLQLLTRRNATERMMQYGAGSTRITPTIFRGRFRFNQEGKAVSCNYHALFFRMPYKKYFIINGVAVRAAYSLQQFIHEKKKQGL